MISSDLDGLARSFAREASNLLNGTVTDGVRLNAVHIGGTEHSVVAPGVGRSGLSADFVPLKIGRRSPTGYLLVAFITQLDDEDQYLAVSKSQFGLYLEPDRKKMLLHFDYSREPGNQYPDAHVQVSGASRTLSAWCEALGRPARKLERLHLPVGGRRFRPTLEDVIEFLVVEGLARPRPGWEHEIEASRTRWLVRQLKAAVRRDPESAAAALAATGRVWPVAGQGERWAVRTAWPRA